MKIVQINTFANGSTGKLASSIHEMLLQEGHDAYFYYGLGASDLKNAVRICTPLSVHVHAVLSRYIGLQGYFSVFPTLKLLCELSRIEPDIIHLHNIHGSYVNWPLLFGFIARKKIKIVMTLHDCCMFTGKCPHYAVVKCSKWKSECGSCPQLKRYPTSIFFDFTKKILADKKKWFGKIEECHIVTVSKWLEEQVKQSFLKKYDVQCIYNGIDTELFCPTNTTEVVKKYHLEGKFFVLGVASEWSDNKGFKSFWELSQRLSEDEIIVLVGKNDDIRNRVNDKFVLIDRTESQRDLAELYTNAGVLISFSQEETFGLVLVEAMACGTPVIAVNSTASPELIFKDCGYLVEPGDIKSLRYAIDDIRGSKIDFASICRDEVCDRFSKNQMQIQYMELYSKVYKS